MSDVASPPMMSMMAWWDPKDRTVTLYPGSLVPGLLCVDGKSIAFVTPTARVFDCPLRETTLSMEGFLQASSCSFRIMCSDTIYRMYLTRHGARKLSRDQLEGLEKDQLEGVEGALNATSAGVGLAGGSLAGFASVLSFMGNAVQTYSVMRSLTKARSNYKLLQERVSSSGEIQIR